MAHNDFELLNKEKILKELLKFSNGYGKNINEAQKSYHLSYITFVKFFKIKQRLNLDDIIVGMSFTYSWMPTILTIKIPSGSRANLVKIANKAKSSKQFLSASELLELKAIINNSLIGSSKLLHFINPNKYPIFDSRVGEFLFNKMKDKNKSDPDFYLRYVDFMKFLVKHPISKKIALKLNSKLGTKLGTMRALEFCMYGISAGE